MSTLSTTNIKNPSSVSNNLVLGTDNSTTLDTAKVTTLADSLGANTSTPAEIYSGRAKAWVNFNGTGTVAIRAAYNVSSITDGGVGTYSINFTTALQDANYVVAGFTIYPTTTELAGLLTYGNNYVPSATSAPIKTSNSANALAVDPAYVNVLFFR